MQIKIPFFGKEKKEKNKAPLNTPINAERIKSVWDRLQDINNKTERYNFEAQYGKLPEKINQIDKNQALNLNMWANVKEGDIEIGYEDDTTSNIKNPNTNVISKLKTHSKIKSIKDMNTDQYIKGTKPLVPADDSEVKDDAEVKDDSEVKTEGLLKRYTELREDAFLMDYIDRYREEVNENHIEPKFTNDVGKDDYVDDEGRHAKQQLEKAAEYSVKLAQMLGDMDQLPAWVQEKITKASDYISTVYHYLDYEMSRSEDDLKQNMDNHITESRKYLMGEEESEEVLQPTTKHSPPPNLSITLRNLGLTGNTIDSVKIVQTNIPTYKINLVNGEGFYLRHQDENDPFIADISFKDYDMGDLVGGVNQAKDAVYNLLTQDQFQGLGGDEEGGEDFGGEEEPTEEPAEEQPTD